MVETSPASLTEAQIAAIVQGLIPAPSTSFVGNGLPMTVAELFTTYPADATRNGLYARVSNLYNGNSTSSIGGIDDIVRCRLDATNGAYRWVPQRDAYVVSQAPSTGSVTLMPLVTPPSLRLTGTLVGNLTISPSTLNAYVGQTFEIIQNSTLGLFVTTITGLLGSNLALLGNNTQQLIYTATGWNKATP